MPPIGFHINTKLTDGRVIAPNSAARRIVARSVIELCVGERLLVFRSADNHLHLEVVCDRERAGRLMQRLGSSLSQRLGLPVPFLPAWYEPIANQRHAYHVFDYILDQELRHGTAADPWYEASNLPDLLGLRRLGAYTLDHVRAWLPRVAVEQLRGRLDRIVLPMAGSEAEQIAEAAAAAFAIPEWRGSTTTIVQARCAAVHAAPVDLPAAELGEALATSRRTVRRLRSQEPAPGSVPLVRAQLAVRRAAASRHAARALRGGTTAPQQPAPRSQ